MGRRYTVPFKIIETRLSSLSDSVACVTQPVIANTNKQSPIQIKIVSLDICFGRPIRCGLISAVKSVVSSVQEGNTVTRVIYRSTGSHRQHKQTNPILNKNSIPWYLFLVTIRPTGLWTLCYKVNTIQQTQLMELVARPMWIVKPNCSNRQNNGSGTYRIGTLYLYIKKLQ